MIRNSIILEKTVIEGQIRRIVADSPRGAILSTLNISKPKIILKPFPNPKETSTKTHLTAIFRTITIPKINKNKNQRVVSRTLLAGIDRRERGHRRRKSSAS
jgi:hypothetical protein